ncbi:efflux RND transporter periplasmic adaptor subunit [Myroides sp. LJL115]
MDQVIPGKNRKKVKVLVIISALLILIGLSYVTFFRNVVLNVPKNEIRVREVYLGDFEEYISFMAHVEPLHSRLINIVESGEIQEIFVENGELLQTGQIIARIYNPTSEFNYMSSENSLIEQINNLRGTKNSIRSQEVNLIKDLIAIEHDYTAAELLYNLHEKLFNQEVLSQSDWMRTQENFNYQNKRKALMEQSIERENKYNELQILQIDKSIVVLEKSLEKLRHNQGNFLLKAPIAGRLSNFEAVLGKTYQSGESIGKIDILKGYKLVALVDEFYLDKVSVGQQGRIDYQGNNLQVKVSRLLPEVKQGQFEVQLELENPSEFAMQEGSSITVKLLLSGQTQKLLLSKGSFHQDTNGKWVYVIQNGKASIKQVKLGKENPLYYEVLEGLQQGDQVIISSYKNFMNVEHLNIKE